jgi:hypothetical protein
MLMQKEHVEHKEQTGAKKMGFLTKSFSEF